MPLDESVTQQPNPLEAARSVERVVARVASIAAIRGETMISYCRMFFCCAILLRFLALDVNLPPVAYVVNISALTTGIGFSTWFLRARRARVAAVALPLACAADAVVCFLSLMQTALWSPELEGYGGLLTGADLCVVPLLVFAGAFRLSTRLAALNGALQGLSLACLLLIDRHRFGARLGYGVSEVSLFGVVFVTSVMAAVLMARHARALAESAALDSLRVESARRDITQLLREQHDTRSLLSAASLNAELVCNALGKPDTGGDPRPMQWAEALRSDLATINHWTRSFGERVFAQLSAIRELEAVDTRLVIPSTLSALAQRFRKIRLESDLTALPVVSLAGGAASLQRILLNLVANAVEGDGVRGAACIHVTTQVNGQLLLLRVEDDGPGFGFAAPGSPGNSCLTTKEHGSGLGLYAVSHVLEASGGFFSRQDRTANGAVVIAAMSISRR